MDDLGEREEGEGENGEGPEIFLGGILQTLLQSWDLVRPDN
jgi:hypothetical protein